MSLGRFSWSDAGVKNHRLSLAVNRAATGPDFRLTRLARRPERDGQRFPFGQIAAADVPPVFRPALVAERMQLIEEMIKTSVINGSVRIIHPLGRNCDVKNRTGGIGLGVRRSRLDGGSRTGNRFVG